MLLAVLVPGQPDQETYDASPTANTVASTGHRSPGNLSCPWDAYGPVTESSDSTYVRWFSLSPSSAAT